MKTSRTIKSLTLIFTLLILLGLAFTAAQARPLSTDTGANPAVPALPTASETPVYDAAQFTDSWGIAPDSMISCDPGNDLLLQVKPGQARSTNSLQASLCRKQAAEETALARASVMSASASSGSCSSGYGATGDGRQIKVYSGYSDTRYVYLQCGKKVAEYGPATCNCGSGFRYGYSCKKPPTVYITIPCR